MPNALNATRYAALGAALIAMSYGLARFAFGLYVPAIRVDLGLSPEIIGRIGAMPYLSFCLASAFASGVVDRLGARGAALTACLFGLLGLAVMSEAQNAWMLAAGVFACGICTGLMMPALTGGMQVAVRPAVHGRVGAIMNAGTSLGVVIAVPTALWLAGQWRGSYIGFAAVAGFCALLAWWFLPNSAGVEHAPAGHGPVSSGRKALRRLALFAFGMGLTSSAYWVFAPDLITTLGDLPDRASAWLWLTLGLAGLLAGAAASDLADRIGIALTQGLALAAMSATLAIIALWPGSLFAALASAALFGAVYMMLTGIHLVTGVRLLPHHPSLGPVIPFLAIALGQAAGSPLVGILETRLGYVHAFLVIAAAGLALALSSRWFPTTRPADDE